MAKRFFVIAGLTAVGALGCMFFPKSPPPAQSGPIAMAELTLPDLDEDGQGERLHILPTGEGGQLVQLEATGSPRPHDMLTLRARGPLRFEEREKEWDLVDAESKPVATVRLYENPAPLRPDLIVLAGDQAKRYVFIERGFLKLDASEVIPGFSVGLIMMGDREAALTTIGGPVDAKGTWHQPLSRPVPIKVEFNDEKRVSGITYSTDQLVMKDAFKVGASADTLDGIYPGRLESSDTWISPRYGITGHLDPGAQKVEAITITRPWTEGGTR